MAKKKVIFEETKDFLIVNQSKHFRACSTTCINKKGEFINRPLKDSIAIEQKIITTDYSFLGENTKKDFYIVIAFLKWDKKTKEAIFEPVGERLKAVKGSIFNIARRIELNKCIKDAEKRIYAENNKPKGDKNERNN